jgi:hypothetical protein
MGLVSFDAIVNALLQGIIKVHRNMGTYFITASFCSKANIFMEQKDIAIKISLLLLKLGNNGSDSDGTSTGA